VRRAKLALLVPIVPLLALAAPAAAAQAASSGSQAATTSDQAADTTFTCYPNTPAAFNVAVSNVVDKQTTTTLNDGTPIPGGFVAQSDPPNYPNVTSGQLVQTFTNETTGSPLPAM